MSNEALLKQGLNLDALLLGVSIVNDGFVTMQSAKIGYKYTQYLQIHDICIFCSNEKGAQVQHILGRATVSLLSRVCVA
jgi:hypothetical protein